MELLINVRNVCEKYSARFEGIRASFWSIYNKPNIGNLHGKRQKTFLNTVMLAFILFYKNFQQKYFISYTYNRY
jgi:hypothetical protein